MKSLVVILTLLCSLQAILVQAQRPAIQGGVTHYLLIDSTIVSGHMVRQDSSVVVIRKRGGELTYIQPYQIARIVEPTYRSKGGEDSGALRSFTLKDGAVVQGRVVRQTPIAVIVRQQNGRETYIDPGDILTNTATVVPDNAARLGIGTPYLLNGRTALTPGAGQVYYRNTYLIRNEVEVGITNGWSAGVVFNPLLTDLYKTSELLNDAVYINTDFGTQLYTRVGIPIGQKIRIGAVFSAQLQHPSYLTRTLASYQGTLLATLGDQHTNLTLGYSFRLHSDSFAPYLNTEEAISIGTMISLSPSLTFISDNSIKVKSSYYSPFARLSAALRINSRRHAFDLGILSAVNQLYTFTTLYSYQSIKFDAYPYVGYQVRFGQ